MNMSDNRASQLIQQLRDALEMGDDDLARQIRSDLFNHVLVIIANLEVHIFKKDSFLRFPKILFFPQSWGHIKTSPL